MAGIKSAIWWATFQEIKATDKIALVPFSTLWGMQLMDMHYYDWQGGVPINETSRDSNHHITATFPKLISLICQSRTLSEQWKKNEVGKHRGSNYLKVKAMLLSLLVSYLCFE